jgi:hypothetical protein
VYNSDLNEKESKMPKMKKRAKGAPASSAISVRRKFRIGNAKGGKSALQMSTEALKEVLNNDNKSMKKFHKNARNVLAQRGIRVDWHQGLVADNTVADNSDQCDSPA